MPNTDLSKNKLLIVWHVGVNCISFMEVRIWPRSIKNMSTLQIKRKYRLVDIGILQYGDNSIYDTHIKLTFSDSNYFYIYTFV